MIVTHRYRRAARAFFLFIAALLGPRELGAQATRPGAPGPAAVADSFFAAFAAERWRDAAALLDLPAFDRMRAESVEQFRRSGPLPRLTLAQIMRRDPQMPRVVAQYQLRKAREMDAGLRKLGTASLTAQEFAYVPNADSLAKLPVLEAAARWLEARDQRYVMRQYLEVMRSQGCELSAADAASLVRAEPPRVVIGVVLENDSSAFVLHRMRDEGRLASDETHHAPAGRQWYATTPSVLPLRLVDGAWRIFGRDFGTGGFAVSGDFCRGRSKRGSPRRPA